MSSDSKCVLFPHVPHVPQVLCPTCAVGSGSMMKGRSKRAKEGSKRSSATLESLSDVERALSESKDSAAAVSELFYCLCIVVNECPWGQHEHVPH